MRRIVDLTATLRRRVGGVDWQTNSTIEADGWNSRKLLLYSHCGTHMDAPRHFVPGGETLENLPLETMVGPALVADLTPVEPSEELTVERLSPWAQRIDRGSRLLLRTDWSLHVGEPDHTKRNPHVGAALAEWLVKRGVALLGVEPHSVANTGDKEQCTRVHRILLEAGVVIVEGLANLGELTRDEVELIVLPLKVEGGDGSPARALAIEAAEP